MELSLEMLLILQSYGEVVKGVCFNKNAISHDYDMTD